MAATPASRSAFVKSCVDMFIKGQVPGVDPVNGVGVFDGIDIDWEYPTGGGLPDNTSSPAGIRAAVDGERDAAESLMTELLPRVRNLVRYSVHIDSEVDDITQESLVAILRGLPTYRGQ